MRPLLLPGLLDAARHNTAHGRAGVALFESAHVYRPAGPLEPAPDGSPGGATPADEHHHLAALLTEATPAGWRTPARDGRLLRREGPPGGAAGGGRHRADWRAARTRGGRGPRPFLHPGRQASVVTARGGGARLDRRAASARASRVGAPGAGGRLRARRRRCCTSSPSGASRPTGCDELPRCVAGHRRDRSRRRSGRPARRGRCARAPAICSPPRGCSTSTTASRWGRATSRSPCGSSSAHPDRTLTDEEVAERRAAIEKELESIGGRLRA